MPQHTIELECPSCRSLLELDAGFAGGVCRCSTCGTMMTVPNDPQRESPERLRRPDRPESAKASATAGSTPSRPDQPQQPPADAPVDAPPSPSPAGADRPELPSPQISPTGQSPSAITGAAGATGSGSGLATHATATYVTASGRKVRISRSTRVPMARRKRRMMARTITATVVVVTAAALLVMMGWFIFFSDFMQRDRHDDPARHEYQPRVNPFLADSPRFIDMSIEDGTVLVVQAGGPQLSPDGFQQVRHLVEHSSGLLDEDASFAVAYFGTASFRMFPPDGPAAWTSQRRQDLAAFHRRIHYEPGVGRPVPAIEAALDAGAARLIFVTSQSLDTEEEQALQRLLAASPQTRFDVVMFGFNDDSLRDLATQRHGRALQINTRQFAQWYQEAAAAED